MAHVDQHSTGSWLKSCLGDIPVLDGSKILISAQPALSSPCCFQLCRYAGYFVSHWRRGLLEPSCSFTDSCQYSTRSPISTQRAILMFLIGLMGLRCLWKIFLLLVPKGNHTLILPIWLRTFLCKIICQRGELGTYIAQHGDNSNAKFLIYLNKIGWVRVKLE